MESPPTTGRRDPHDRARAAAIVDLDGTLLRGDSEALELRLLLRRGRLKLWRLGGLAAVVPRYWAGVAAPGDIDIRYIELFRGWPAGALDDHADELFETALRPRLAPAVLERIEQHRRGGDALVLASATLEHMLRPVAAHLGFDHTLGTSLEVDGDGRLTGRPRGALCIGEEKRRRVEALADAHGFDLDASCAYSDHHFDLPLLRAVGHPVAVAPTRRLEQVARRAGWPVLRP